MTRDAANSIGAAGCLVAQPRDPCARVVRPDRLPKTPLEGSRTDRNPLRRISLRRYVRWSEYVPGGT